MANFDNSNSIRRSNLLVPIPNLALQLQQLTSIAKLVIQVAFRPICSSAFSLTRKLFPNGVAAKAALALNIKYFLLSKCKVPIL